MLFHYVQEGCDSIYLKVVPLHLEVGDLHVIGEEMVITLEDIISTSSIPGPNSIFKWDSKKEFLCQLNETVCTIIPEVFLRIWPLHKLMHAYTCRITSVLLLHIL